MQLTFKSITWKNFLSTGNASTTMRLDNHNTTLIMGSNGSGKSTLLDALTFVLFGKPFRNINKPQLMNSINNKNCEVAIEFTIGTVDYRVVRGLKPTVFEIYKNKELLNQDAAAKDYQTMLENQILGLNYKTFTQVVILGSASFVPFMQLPAHQRREVIEDILDIGVFSTMNQLLKERVAQTKADLTDVEAQISIAKNTVTAQKKLIAAMTTSKTEQVDNLEKQIAESELQITSYIAKAEAVEAEIIDLSNTLPDKKQSDELIDAYNSDIQKIIAESKNIRKTLKFFNETAACPTCEQNISDDHKENVLSKSSEKLSEYDFLLESVNAKCDEQLKIQEQWQTINAKIGELNTQCTMLNHTVSMMNKNNVKLKAEVESAKKDTTNIDAEKKILKDTAEQAVKLIEKKSELLKQRDIHEVASILLKDTGIKTAIIREYLPVMNKLINTYLTGMDLFVHFELDEAFNEVIKSRFRDEFTYDSFSEGEKQKIDIAILFSWRQIAKMKNSINTNLLIFDEIFDSSLDNMGTDYLMTLLNSLGTKTNVFVISHRGDQLIDKFDSLVRFEKKNDFSTMM